MPRRDIDRDAFIRRIERKRRWASRAMRARKALGLLDSSIQSAIYDATYRDDAEVVAYSYAQENDHLPDLNRPVWFNEKVRWQFLNHPNPLMSLAADKIAVRDYLVLKGARIEAPALIATFDSLCDIAAFDFPRTYALKSSFGTGQNLLQDGTRTLAREAILSEAASWLNWDQWRSTGEFHYRTLRKRWLAEEFLPCACGQVEYKVFCMMGRPAFILVITDREGPNTYRRRLYDCDWKPADFHWLGNPPDPAPLPRPADLDLILAEATRLAEDFMHVRVDFLRCDDRLTFSELTFASAAARVPFTPVEANVRLGALMDLDRADEYLARGRHVAQMLGWGLPSRPEPRAPIVASAPAAVQAIAS